MYPKITLLHASICSALGSPARIEILNALSEGEKNVKEITNRLGLRQANVSQHLSVLRQRNIVLARREGNTTVYAVSNPKIITACRLMREVLLEQFEKNEELVAELRDVTG